MSLQWCTSREKRLGQNRELWYMCVCLCACVRVCVCLWLLSALRKGLGAVQCHRPSLFISAEACVSSLASQLVPSQPAKQLATQHHALISFRQTLFVIDNE